MGTRSSTRTGQVVRDTDYREQVSIHGALLGIAIEVVRHNPDGQGKSLVP
ncbi:hypothetical protein [Streptomyces pratensis]